MTKPTQPSNNPTGGSWTMVFNNAREINCVARVRDFVVAGGISEYTLSDQDGYYIRWSAIGDPTDWPIPATDDARAKQSGQQGFAQEYGWVTAIAGNDFFGYVFQERAITKMTYVGGDVVFTFDTFEEDRGCIAGGRMVQVDDMVFFQSARGYHLLLDDQIQDIGYGIVDDSYV